MRVAAVLAVVAVLSGCGALPGEPRADAVPQSEVTCGEAGLPAEGVVGGAVPEGFVPVAVHRCTAFAEFIDESGTWSGTRIERLEGDLAGLLTALAEPDDAPSLGACTADMWIGPELWLADAAGRYIRVPYPADGCGKPKRDVLERIDAALDALTVTEERFEPAVLMHSPEAEAAGCATGADVFVLAEVDPAASDDKTVAPAPDGDTAATSAPDGDVSLVPMTMPALPAADEVTGMRLCRYAAGTPSSDGLAFATAQTAFVGAEELDAAAARELLTLVATASAAVACSETASALVVAHPLPEAAASFTVELDGCRRAVGPDFVARVAPAALLSLLAS